MDSLLSMNKVFISKLNGILEDNYQNENFGVSELAEVANISRSQLHRKLKLILGLRTSEFIKLFRLQKAHTLLKNNVSTVSEIAYSVGFSNPSYFSKCFYKEYKCTPGELKHKLSDQETVQSDAPSNLKLLLKNFVYNKHIFLGQFKIKTYKVLILLLLTVAIPLLYNSLNVSNEQLTKSIAILPLDAKTNLMNEEILSNGIHEGLTSSLGKIIGVRVLSKSSSLKYKNSKMTKKEIIKELGVDFLISGNIDYLDTDSLNLNLTVHKSNLLDSEFQTFTYNAPIENIIYVQNKASKSIGQSIGLIKESEYLEVGHNNRKVNKEAYKNYIRGMYHLHKSSQKDFDKGMQFLYKAVDEDPAEPLAYAGLAYGYVILGHSAAENSNVFGKAKMLAKKAIQLDSTLLEAYAAIASINIYHDRNWAEAEALFQHLFLKNPSMSNVHYDYAWFCLLLGEKEKALKHHAIAEKLDPTNTKYLAWGAWMEAYYTNYKRAMEKAEMALLIAPKNGVAHSVKGFIYWSQNDTTKAMKCYNRAFELSPKNASLIGDFYAKTGDLEKVNNLIEEAKGWPKSPWKNWTLAVLYANLNDAEKSVNMLETDPKHAFVAWAPALSLFDDIKSHYKFKSFVSSLDIPIRTKSALANNLKLKISLLEQ